MGVRQNVPENAAGKVGEDLPVGERAVDARTHRAEIAASQLRIDRRASELAVRQGQSAGSCIQRHLLEKLRADLMAESTRAAVDADHHLPWFQVEGVRGAAIEDLLHLLHLEIVIARTQRAHFVALAAFGLLRNLRRVSAGHAAMLLDALQVFLLSPAALDGPLGPTPQHGRHVLAGQANCAGAAHACGDLCKQRVRQPLFHGLDIGARESGVQGAHAAGNIEPDTARRNHAAKIRIEGGHTADGKAVTPVRVGHGVGRFHDAWEAGDIHDLLIHFVVHGLDQLLVGEDDARNPHRAMRLDAPFVGVHPH